MRLNKDNGLLKMKITEFYVKWLKKYSLCADKTTDEARQIEEAYKDIETLKSICENRNRF